MELTYGGSKCEIHNYLLICDTFAFMTIIGPKNKFSRLELVKK